MPWPLQSRSGPCLPDPRSKWMIADGSVFQRPLNGQPAFATPPKRALGRKDRCRLKAMTFAGKDRKSPGTQRLAKVASNPPNRRGSHRNFRCTGRFQSEFFNVLEGPRQRFSMYWRFPTKIINVPGGGSPNISMYRTGWVEGFRWSGGRRVD